MPRSPHRTGRPFRRAKALMFEHFGTVCHLCGHSGGLEADHLDPVSLDPDQPVDWRTMRPSHGSNYPCPTCGRKCNQERGVKPIEALFRPTLDW